MLLRPRRLLPALLGLTALTAVLAMAVLDARRYDGKVLRNTTVAGESIGGLDGPALDAFIADLDGRYRVMPVRLAAPGGGPAGVGADFGVSVDRALLRSRALDAGRPGGAVARFVSYLTSGLRSRTVEVPTRIDTTVLATSLARLDAARRVEPKDPRLELDGRRFIVIPGSDGNGIDPAPVAAELPRLLKGGPDPVTLTVNRVTLRSRYSAEQVQELAREASKLTASPLRVVVGEKGGVIPAADLRQWVQPTIVDGQVRLGIDEKAAGAGIRRILGRVGRPARDARLEVADDGTVRTVPAEPGLVCCSAESLRAIGAALENPTGEAVRIDLREVEASLTTEEVERLGVTTMVSRFTTRHAAGEDRVKNIHHIADLLRGRVIQPGETFSVNRDIGPRSAANGFVLAHVIEDGVYAENYGGGISQFATTMFNAAFYAGLDLVEYQSHSLYIKRYPYGIEATLSYPRPDLKIRNNTPYAVMIWPTYTASSITVALYSTPFVTGEVADQTKSKRNLCTIVITTRRRVYLDGRVANDKIRAAYRPKEGIDCNGDPTPGATTTTLRPADTTVDTALDNEPLPEDIVAPEGGQGSAEPTTTSRRRTSTTRAGEPAAQPEPTSVPAATVPATLPPVQAGGGPPVTGVG
jgi:vancomycin resistance protein YoaR